MKFFLLSLILSLVAFNANAQSMATSATVVFVKGDVKIFHGQKRVGKHKVVLYEGKQYSYEAAKAGTKVRPADVIHSGPNGRAKVVYANGDHFVIGEGSSVQLPAAVGSGEKKNPTLNMFYGKIRAMISKTGPLNRLKVKTKAAVAGVRGTDFFVDDEGVDGTKVTVLRGKVNVSVPDPKKNSIVKQEAVVQAGFSVKVEPSVEQSMTKNAMPSKAPKVSVYEAPKEELLVIQKNSMVQVMPESAALPEKVAEEIKELEKSATKAVIADIKVEDSKLYETIQSEKITSVDEINTAVVSKLYQTAPVEKKKLKPSEDEIDDLGGEEIYKKYFRGK